MPLRHALLIAALAVPSAAFAQSQPFEPLEPEARWTVQVGAGVYSSFSPTTRDEVIATPWVSGTYRDFVEVNPIDGLSVNIVTQERVRLGVQLRPRFAQPDIKDLGLRRPGVGADAGVYGYVRLPGNVVFGGSVVGDASSDDAGVEYTASLAYRRITPVGLASVSLYARGGDEKRNGHVFGVTASDSAISGLPGFGPKRGLAAVGGTLILLAPIRDRYAVGAFANYESLDDRTADSPLVRRERAGWTVGVGAGMLFQSGL